MSGSLAGFQAILQQDRSGAPENACGFAAKIPVDFCSAI